MANALSVVLLLVGVILCCGCSGSQMDRDTQQQRLDQVRNEEQLLRSLADQNASHIASACEQARLADPSLAEMSLLWRMMYADSAWSIAISDNPRIGIADLLVLAGLCHAKAQSLLPQRMGATAAVVIVTAHAALVQQTRQRCIEMLGEDATTRIEVLTSAWLDKHADIDQVNWVRLTNLDQLTRTRDNSLIRLGEQLNPLRMLNLDPLSGLDPTARSIDDTRRTVEKLTYLANRIPTRVMWQAELLTLRVSGTPAMRTAIDSMSRAATAALVVAEVASWLPENIARERAAIVHDLSVHSATASALITQLTALLAQTESSSREIALVLAEINALAAPTSASASRGRPFDIREYTQALAQAATTAKVLDRLLHSASAAARDADTLAGPVINLIWWRLVQLVALVLVAIGVYRMVMRRWTGA